MLSKELREVDVALYRLAREVRTLYYINPINAAHEREHFFREVHRGHRYAPRFRYRPLKFDVGKTTRALVALEKKLDNSELGTLYKRKIDEINTEVLLVGAVGDRQRFLGYSVSLYGIPSVSPYGVARSLEVAKLWLAAPREEEPKVVPAMGPGSAESVLKEEISRYGFKCSVRVKEHMSANAAAGESGISLRKGVVYSAKECVRLAVHEVGFHVVTTYNAKQHAIRLFEIGTPGYLADQEGGAIWAEEEAKALTNQRLAILGARTVGIDLAVSGADFFDVFREMVDRHRFDEDDAYYICERVFRGGLFTKDAIYEHGFNKVRNAFRFGVADPYVFICGKMTVEDVPLASALLEAKLLRPPKFTPRFLRDREWISTWRTLSRTNDLFREQDFRR